MKSKLLFFAIGGLVLLSLLIGGLEEAMADISIWGDKFTVAGFLRHELAIHTAGRNPNNADNHDFSLSRSFFQTEWTFKPTDKFKVYAKVRLTGDQTYHIDDELPRYNAFPVDVPKYDWTLMKASEDDFRAEVWEFYSDITLGNLWLRLGKQQIAWGEMIGLRLMDAINSVDNSWHFIFEPEEFENIRIPNWMIRFSYLVAKTPSWLSDFTVEGFVNPGDVIPNFYADSGAPFNLFPTFPPFFRFTEKDRRGDTEYGFRVGGMIGGFYITLNFLHVYNDDFALQMKGLVPDPIFGIPIFAPFDFTPFSFLIDKEYPLTEIYGLTGNYAIAGRINTVITYEAKWVPNQPYADARSPFPAIRDQGTFSHSIRFDRLTFLLPRPQNAAMIQFQIAQVLVEGDEDKILGPAKVDKDQEIIGGLITQTLWHNNVSIGMQALYDLDGAHFLKPFFKYVYGDHWYFDLFAIFLGGEEKRAGRFGSLTWADEVLFRATFQF